MIAIGSDCERLENMRRAGKETQKVVRGSRNSQDHDALVVRALSNMSNNSVRSSSFATSKAVI